MLRQTVVLTFLVRNKNQKKEKQYKRASGVAFPFRCGFASHLGLALGKPTVGAAKSKLISTEVEKDSRTLLLDRGEVIGEAVTTKPGAKPIYVRIGHMVSLETAVETVRHCAKTRIPEPLRQVQNLATKQRIRLASESKVNI